MQCPKCHSVFEPGMSLCPDCHVQLEKEEESPNSQDSGDSLVPIGSAPNEAVAKIWIQILEESGIPSIMRSGRPMSGLLGDFSFNLPCDIYVLESQAELAAEILESLIEEENMVPGENEDPFSPQ